MREKVKDKGRLEHILQACNDLLTEIPWEQMIGLRHVLVHGYYTIKPKQLWNIIEKDIPVLMPQIKQLLDSEKFTEE